MIISKPLTTQDDDQKVRPFSDTAGTLEAHGLAVIPVGGDDGKTPLVKWKNWSKPPSSAFLNKLIYRHANENIAIVCNLSQVTVVDIDAPELLRPMLDRFGDTPLITRTPRGGYHLWYRHSGERSSDLRGEGLDVDIKGRGGIIVVPPSVARAFPNAGRPYLFERGSWDQLSMLATIREGSLEKDRGGSQKATATPLGRRRIPQGQRNDMLFKLLLQQARFCDNIEDLLDVAHTFNEQNFEEPLPTAEVDKTVHSAWALEENGNNWVGREARVIIPRSEFEILQENSDALVLLTKLRLEHGARWQSFSLSPKAMTRSEAIVGWRTEHRYRNARDFLLDRGFLEQTHVGGRRHRDPHLFRLSSPSTAAEIKGVKSTPNIIKHLPLELEIALGRSGQAVGVEFGRTLRQVGSFTALSQNELAKRAGVSRSSISNIESGRQNPSSKTKRMLETAISSHQSGNGSRDAA